MEATLSTDGGSKDKEINGDKPVILYRLGQQDRALNEIKAAIDELKRPRSDWKPLMGMFGIFMVALGATYWPLENRIQLLERADASTKELYQKDKEFMLEKLRAIDRELVWHFDNIKVRIGAVEQKQELWMKNKPENKP